MTRDDVVRAARAWIGTPYRHQAATLRAGCDCLGLLRGVWRSVYGDEPAVLPNYRADWRDTRHADELLALAERLLVRTDDQLQAGQVVLFQLGRTALPKHCGILVDGTRFVHAQEGLGVVEANLTDGWRKRIARLYDFPGVTI
jgi:NlpC/P60 family putative phage cell wall peptidase